MLDLQLEPVRIRYGQTTQIVRDEGCLIHPQIDEVVPDSGHMGLILGDVGQGKSVIGNSMLEHFSKKYNRKAFMFGMPQDKQALFPAWITHIDDLTDLEEHSICLFDESHLAYYSRNSSSKANKFVDQLAGLIRHIDVIAIYISQQSRRLEIGIVSSCAFLIFKRPSLLQSRFDRPQIREMISEVVEEFRAVEPPEETSKKEWMKHCAYVIGGDFEGMVEDSNIAPDWWNEDISKSYSGVALSKEEGVDGVDESTLYGRLSILCSKDKSCELYLKNIYDKYNELIGDSSIDARFTLAELGIPQAFASKLEKAGLLIRYYERRNGAVQYYISDINPVKQVLEERGVIHGRTIE